MKIEPSYILLNNLKILTIPSIFNLAYENGLDEFNKKTRFFNLVL